MARVAVAGAGGPLGRRTVAELADRGNVAVGLLDPGRRDDVQAAERAVGAAGGVPRRASLADADDLAWALGDADAVVHAAGAEFGPVRRPADRERRREVRAGGAQALTAAAGETGADRYVQASIAWVVRKPGGGPVDADDAPSGDDAVAPALLAERRAGAARKFDLAPATLRTGWLYGPGVPETRWLARRLLARRLPAVGGGLLGRRDAPLSVVHVDDAAAALADAAEGEATGTYHVADGSPVTAAAFLRTLADELGAAPPRRVPAWLARPLLGADAAEFLTTGFPTDADGLADAFGWAPGHADHRDGLRATVERWVTDGTLVATDDGYEWAGPD